jgi:hypothetical protein
MSVNNKLPVNNKDFSLTQKKSNQRIKYQPPLIEGIISLITKYSSYIRRFSMRYGFLTAIAICFLLMFSACTEKSQPSAVIPPENDDWAAYMPLETGSSWIYESAGKNSDIPGITITITGREKIGKGEAALSDLIVGGQLQRREFLELIPGKGIFSRRRDAYIGGKQNVFAPDTDDAVLRFPLKVGETWEWEDNSPQKIKGINRFKVAAYEEVTVPAGVYRAFRIDIQQVDPSGGQVMTSLWLAKDVGMVKQSTSAVLPGKDAKPLPELVFVLKEYVKGKDVPEAQKPTAATPAQPPSAASPAPSAAAPGKVVY